VHLREIPRGFYSNAWFGRKKKGGKENSSRRKDQTEVARCREKGSGESPPRALVSEKREGERGCAQEKRGGYA